MITSGDICRGFEAGMDFDVFGSLDSKANPISTHFQNRNFNIIGDDDLLVFVPTRSAMVSETNYLNQLALRGFNLETQGLLIESLDGRNVYAELNSNVGFNPASVIKVATSFGALTTFGPDYHFETSFYTDGT